MRILHLSSYDITGGAARVAYRLHQGLRALGHDSRMLVRHKASQDDSVVQVDLQKHPGLADQELFWLRTLQEFYFRRNRTELSNTPFTFGIPGLDLAGEIAQLAPDLIHLHWITGLLSPEAVRGLLSGPIPVVWTLHDQWVFTGGCHYTMGCTGYQHGCESCPQLQGDPLGIVPKCLADKRLAFSHPDLTFIPSSQWLGQCLQASTLGLEPSQIRVLPNGIDPEAFSPLDKTAARTKLGLPAEALVILFIAETNKEKRKGLDLLREALSIALARPEVRKFAQSRPIHLALVGAGDSSKQEFPAPTKALGYFHSDHDLATAYSAADLVAIPSIEDNMPGTAIEALSCGTAIIGFRSGGIVDIVGPNQEAGSIAPETTASSLAECLARCILNSEELPKMGARGRQRILELYTQERVAAQHVALYEEQLQKRGASSKGPGMSGQSVPHGQDRQDRVVPIGPNLAGVFEALTCHCAAKAALHSQKLSDDLKSCKKTSAKTSAKIKELKATRWHRLGAVLRVLPRGL